MEDPPGTLLGLGQGVQKPLPIRVIKEDLLPAIAPAHDMVDRPRELYAWFAWHTPEASPRSNVNTQIRGLTPASNG